MSNKGDLYWFVRLAAGDEIHFHADRVAIEPSGALVGYTIQKGTEVVVFAVGAGAWTHSYAASVFDGGAVAVEHWDSVTAPSANAKRAGR